MAGKLTMIARAGVSPGHPERFPYFPESTQPTLPGPVVARRNFLHALEEVIVSRSHGAQFFVSAGAFSAPYSALISDWNM
jgi:hypothetical protein